jgi:hypothetical protein
MNELPQIIIYTLCLAASAGCALMLLRGFRRTRMRLLLWTGLCFSCLCVNSLAVVLDILIFPSVDLQMLRLVASLAAVVVLLVGLVWESE